MDWKTKARIQNTISLFPKSIAYNCYYGLQRRFGGLKKVNPEKKVLASIELWEKIIQQGHSPLDKVFFEVGTGRIPILPISYWLMGAKKTITVDLNTYLSSDLLRETLEYISQNIESIKKLFGMHLVEGRLNRLIDFHSQDGFSIDEALEFFNIEYIAPGDASNTMLLGESVDFHTSYNVLEHIPLDILNNIFQEGNRIIKAGGLFIHRIDYSDHFSHSDKEISGINFLQYSDVEWKKFVNNDYMYMNRLRHDDFLNLFKLVNHELLAVETYLDERSLKVINNGTLEVVSPFNMKPDEIICILNAWIVSTKKDI